MNAFAHALMIRGALGIGAALAPSILVVHAQEPEPESVEEIVVTGSRIVRDEFSSSSPISVVSGEEIALSGTVSIDEYLKDVPAFTGYQMGTSTNNGSHFGQKKLDLRGLGFNRTLVLVNGRRMIGDTSFDGAVDLNAIPEAMIDRVEVLKDGASTIYGSDALAGVINVILHDDFEGIQLVARYGAGMEDGQATNSMLGVLAGVGADKGNIVVSLSYTNQDEMLQAERPFAQNELWPVLDTSGEFRAVPSGSMSSRIISVPGEGSYIWDSGIGSARPFDGATDTYNYAPINALIQPNERWQFGMNGKFAISDALEAYVDALHTRRTSQQRLAPDASFAVSPSIQTPNNGIQWNNYVPSSNPFNPFGVNACGNDGICGGANAADDLNPLGISNIGVRIGRRFEESGGRLFRQTADTYRIVAGVRGSLFDDAVDWDVSYLYAENETISETKNYGRFDRWAIAVDPDACASDGACPGVLNPFHEFGSITSEQMAYLTAGSLKDAIGSRMEVGAINFSGSFGDLSGGALGWVIGLEHRTEKGSYSPDEFLAAGLTTSGANDPLSGSFSVDELYGEILLPIRSNLDLSASLRYSDYDTVSSATTYKIGGDWAISDDIRLRATFSTGFRAPNISEINQENLVWFPLVDSLCEFADRRLAAGDITQTIWDNCLALLDNDPFWLGDGGEFGFGMQTWLVFSAPAEPLQPEESTTYTAGFVYEPSFAESLTIGVDYWNIEIAEAIGIADVNNLYYPCLNSPDLSDPACDYFFFGPYNFAINFIYPGGARLEFGNLGTLATDGLDIDLSYAGELDSDIVHGYDLYWSTTWINSHEQRNVQTGTSELLGKAGMSGVYPEVRMNFSAGVFGENWTVDFIGRYIGETTDQYRPCYLTDDCKAEATLYTDVVGTYTWDNIQFNLGIRNLTDEDPPRFHGAFAANTSPGTYDVIGRAYYVGFRWIL